jgi:serine/threonine-protein kinase
MRQALIGLRACHEHGMIHCDVKPGNVFVHDRDRIALGDFGAANRTNERGEVKVGGDPKVRAPEMLRGGAGNVRTDIYSAGVTMHRLLTGRWPVDWPGDFGTLRDRVVGQQFDDVARLAPHLPRTLVQVVRTAMSGPPEDRYGSADEMSRALGRVNLGRRWARIPAHSSHESCWTDAPGGVPAREVCVTKAGRRFVITTRRVSGSRSRITPLCFDDVIGSRLPRDLRRVFGAP